MVESTVRQRTKTIKKSSSVLPEGVVIEVIDPESFVTQHPAKGPLPTVSFTVRVTFNGIELIEIPDFRLIEGRIQIPSTPIRTKQGLLHRKIAKPFFALLQGIHETIMRDTDWEKRFPDVFPLIPIAPRYVTPPGRGSY